MKKCSLMITVISVWLCLCSPAWAWERLRDGMWYQAQKVAAHKATVHLVKIDLGSHRIGLIRAVEHGHARQQITELVSERAVLVAINASFFDVDGQEMGLIVKGGKELNPLRRAAWGVFQIISGRPSIIHTREYRHSSRRQLAIQTGPRLLIDERIPQFRQHEPSRRSGVCITPKGHLILAVVSPSPITLKEFAESLQPHCKTALNLDGGSSTQFYLNTKKKQLLLLGREPVPNVLAVFEQ